MTIETTTCPRCEGFGENAPEWGLSEQCNVCAGTGAVTPEQYANARPMEAIVAAEKAGDITKGFSYRAACFRVVLEERDNG